MPRLIPFLLFAFAAFAQQPFHLKSGDRVVFYGDSITDQRLYTTFVETFVRTRYPELDVTFVHSGWGGDRVTGGGGGPVHLRLERDVAPYKPTVVTIMLGMNDGRYRPFTENIYRDYTEGYMLMLDRLRQVAPSARITLIRPSAYDEVTRPPMPGGGYNPVLVRFGDFLAEYAAKSSMSLIDLNAPLEQALERAQQSDPKLASQLVADRVHPGPAGHLIMAAAMVKQWGASGEVSSVTIDAAGGVAAQTNTVLRDYSASPGALRWKQLDRALPMPIDLGDPLFKLAADSSDFTSQLNRQPLRVVGLAQGHYALRIDGQQAGVFTSSEFDAGLNLATLPTPMFEQARQVHAMTLKHNNVHNARWRVVETPLDPDGFAAQRPAMAALDALENEMVARLREMARPRERLFEIVSVPPEASSVPRGFTPVFDGRSLAGWHISKTNHHGTTPDWKVENGILTGSQNPPGKGGILLTDKSYRNFEVYLELNPDWGCDGGLFLRSSEKGEAYQVLLDYREGGNVGGVYGERLKGVRTFSSTDFEKHWKKGEWNRMRARIEGDIPRIQVWINDVRVTEWGDFANHAAEGAVSGMIAVQVHGGTQIWKEGGQHRFRNIAVRELP